jgi:hypothetical protein
MAPAGNHTPTFLEACFSCGLSQKNNKHLDVMAEEKQEGVSTDEHHHILTSHLATGLVLEEI